LCSSARSDGYPPAGYIPIDPILAEHAVEGAFIHQEIEMSERLAESEAHLVLTIVQLGPSSSSHRLMWSSAKGSGIRSQCTPRAIANVSPRSRRRLNRKLQRCQASVHKEFFSLVTN
jgi:hypothetical protein